MNHPIRPRPVTLHAQQVTDFQADGAVCLRGLFNADELALLRDGLDANLARPSPRAKVASQGDDPGLFIEDFCNWQHSLADLPAIDSDLALNPAAHRTLGWALQPGDAVAFHMLALHAAAGVDGPQRRRVFSVRFLGDDMRHAPRPWTTSPPFPGLADALPAGALVDHALFPLLWPPAGTATPMPQNGP